jgi:hypothetical protein
MTDLKLTEYLFSFEKLRRCPTYDEYKTMINMIGKRWKNDGIVKDRTNSYYYFYKGTADKNKKYNSTAIYNYNLCDTVKLSYGGFASYLGGIIMNNRSLFIFICELMRSTELDFRIKYKIKSIFYDHIYNGFIESVYFVAKDRYDYGTLKILKEKYFIYVFTTEVVDILSVMVSDNVISNIYDYYNDYYNDDYYNEN